MINQHDQTFSIMKGVAIISVVIGHCSIPLIEGFVNQYHLAVFYFIAGYFFNPVYAEKPWEFVRKKICRLYLPFVCYGLVFLLLHNMFCILDCILIVKHMPLPIYCITHYISFCG